MERKPISPKAHCLIDYVLAGSFLIAPAALGLNKKVKEIYTAEGLVLLVYLALTDSPVAVKPLIPFPVHGKIDPFNIAQFALQSFLKPFKRDKKALIFNIAFTTIAGVTVLLTDWAGQTKR